MLYRYGRPYTLAEVLPFVKFVPKQRRKKAIEWDQVRDYEGDPINMASLRLQLFATKGTTCVVCGVVGTQFFKEQHSTDHALKHFNLYGVKEDGTWVLITKDHIKPKSKGGSANLANLQVMCMPCNGQKGSTYSP